MKYFYYKPNRSIEPHCNEQLNYQAKQKLDEIYKTKAHLIPRRFLENWDKVALYHPAGSVERATAILINPDEGAYDINNKINDLTGKEWTRFTSSWFIFNALASDLKQEKDLDPHIEDHPATYSPTMISEFISFFTKEGMKVLDPFCGIGSTMEACKRTGRIGYATELNPKYYDLILKRTPEFRDNIYNVDAAKIPELGFDEIDFCISSPPYWNILNRSTRDFEKKREKRKLDIHYSDKDNDLGNIEDYDTFLNKLSQIYYNIYSILRNKAYVCIILKNVKKGGVLYPLAWDLARKLSSRYVLKDEKLWIQDKVGLAPYGYPFSWSSNIIHHYCLILRKEEK